MRPFVVLALTLLAVAVTATGCGDGKPARLSVVPVRGKVMRGGQPLAGAQVMLHPDASSAAKLGSLRPNGTTASDGTFSLTTYENNDGAPEGTYQATVIWPDEAYQPRTPEEREDFHTGAPKPDKLQGRFQDPARSGLTATVSASTPELTLELPW